MFFRLRKPSRWVCLRSKIGEQDVRKGRELFRRFLKVASGKILMNRL